jgi:dolichol kinase
VIGVTLDPFAAGAALLALSLGDGIGGAIGRAFGEHHFRAPGGKQKSIEGSAVVAIGATCGALVAAALFGVALPFPVAIALGIAAAATEAASPRGTDNILIPAVVYVTAQLLT